MQSAIPSIMAAIMELLPPEAREHHEPTDEELARTFPPGYAGDPRGRGRPSTRNRYLRLITMSTHREMHFDARMSDQEALMWNVEKDPWLNPSGAALAILDRPIDRDQFRRRIRAMVADVPRFVRAGGAGSGPPVAAHVGAGSGVRLRSSRPRPFPAPAGHRPATPRSGRPALRGHPGPHPAVVAVRDDRRLGGRAGCDVLDPAPRHRRRHGPTAPRRDVPGTGARRGRACGGGPRDHRRRRGRGRPSPTSQWRRPVRRAGEHHHPHAGAPRAASGRGRSPTGR